MKKSMKLVAVAAAMTAVLALSGCATGNTSIRNDDVATIQKKVQKGKTTKAQVREMYGNPNATTVSGSNEIWRYAYSQVDAKTYIPFLGVLLGGMDGKEVAITFNKAGVVKNLEITEENLKSGF